MDAIDTQDLIDFLTRGEKAEKLENYFKRVEKRKGKIFISTYTLLELAYLLEYNFGVDRERIAKSLRTILEDRLFKISDKQDFEKALELYAGGMDLLQALKEAHFEKFKVRRLTL
ncbi:MAG: hypothetical protein ACK4LA_01075 [Aquificaceae bacterium]